VSASLALDRLRIVLCETSHPGNIGAAARAMKTMGLRHLLLVSPKVFPAPEATALATGAADLLSEAQVCATLEEALAGTVLAVAMTARERELSAVASNLAEAAREAVAWTVRGEVALVFGTEMSGLSNEQVLRCQRLAHIPTDPQFSSLNLAAAVQVACYELRRMALGEVPPAPRGFAPASSEEIEALHSHAQKALIDLGFLNPARPRRLMPRLRRLFARARLEQEEVNILRGILAAIDVLVRRAGAGQPRN
jgi:tRNA/rRNA methyltransferase